MCAHVGEGGGGRFRQLRALGVCSAFEEYGGQIYAREKTADRG